jgi:hypothetical protein
MNQQDLYMARIIQQIGKPYQWGAWGPDSYDCSGLVSFGLGLESKLNAQELYENFNSKQVTREQAPPGALFFYGKDKQHITHVMTVLTHWSNGGMSLIGARGGDSTTTSLDAARDKPAFVDVCWGDYWLSNFVCAVYPF